MKVKFVIGMSALALVGLSACGKNKEQAAKNVTNDKVQSLGLLNSFAGDCQNSPLDIVGLDASRTSYNLSTGEYIKTTTYFGTDDCKAGTEVLEIAASGRFENVDTLPQDGNIGRIDIIMTKTEVTPKTDDIKNELNKYGTNGYCGINNWGTDRKDVSSQSGTIGCPLTEKLTTTYDIITTQNGELKQGLAIPVIEDKSAPEKRPSHIDPKVLGRK